MRGDQKAGLEQAAKSYVAGKAWERTIILPAKGRVVTLPVYPWQQERFWFAETEELEQNFAGRAVVDAERLEKAAESSSTASWQRMFEELQAVSGEERQRMIREFIQREAAAVLGLRRGALPPLDVPLTSLGLDSLMAVNLRNRMRGALGQELPLRFVIERPTVRSLADALDTILWTMREEAGREHDSLEQDEIRI